MMQEALSASAVPRGVFGLPPDGDRTVAYRFQGDVYEDTAYDITKSLLLSEICRN